MRHKIKIDLKILFSNRWHIGSGIGSPVVDRLTIKDPMGQPYIPGSTLKGVVRHVCENLVQALDLKTSDPHDKTNIEGFCSAENTPYVVDRLFGSRFEGEKLFFRDAVIVEEFYPPSYTSVIARTCIDRATGTTKDKALFNTEYIEKIPLFTTITGIHPQLTVEIDSFPIEYSLLIAALRCCMAIGGDKSTGKGDLDISIENICYNGRDIPIDNVLAVFKEPEFADNYKLLRGEL